MCIGCSRETKEHKLNSAKRCDRVVFAPILLACSLLTCSLLASGAFASDPPITAVAFSPDGKYVVATSQAGLQILSYPELTKQKTIKAAAANLHCLAFSPDGKQLAIGGGNPSEEGIVEIFSWPDAKSLMKLTDHEDSVLSLVWRDDSKLLSSSLDREIKLWDVDKKKVLQTYSGHSRGVTTLRLLKDGKTLVSAGNDQSVRVWNIDSGELVRSLNQHTKPVHALALRPSEGGLRMVASAAGDRTIRFWQPTIGRMVRYVRLQSEPLNIAWLNETLIAAACVDGHVRVVDANKVKVMQDQPGIKGWAYAIAVHPSDGSLVAGGADGQMRRLRFSIEK